MNDRSKAREVIARQTILEILIALARKRERISYSDLVQDLNRKIEGLNLWERDPRLEVWLTDISLTEAKAGRGMLSVLVVHKAKDKLPGNHFYDVVTELGYDATDRRKFCNAEFKVVCQYWSEH
jgi:hypothetical protein